MKIWLKALKVFLLFTVISVLFLFSPVALFPPKVSEVSSSVENIQTYIESEQEVNSGESLGTSASEETCLNCIETSSSEVTEVIEIDDYAEEDLNVQPDCSLEQSTINKDFQVYEKDGIVYVEIYGEITAKKGAAAYDFVRKQGCLTSSPNLVFLNE